MTAVWFNESKPMALDNLLADAIFADAELMLLYTLTELDADMTLADLEADEADFAGYARQPISGFGAATMSGNHARSLSALVSFDNTGADSDPITGWAVVNTVTGEAMYGDVFDTPLTITGGTTWDTAVIAKFTGEVLVTP